MNAVQADPPSGRCMFVTGAARGIGAEIASVAVARGYRVVVADIDLAAAERTAAALGVRACAVALDVREPEQWERALDEAAERFGPVDVLVNNAGIISTGYTRAIATEDLRDTVLVNFFGVIAGVRAALPRMTERGSGHIVNVCSMTAFVPMPGYAVYGGTKHAMRAFHHAVAMEEREGPVCFSIVHPPATDTPMLAKERTDPTAALAFTCTALSPRVIADAVLRAVDDQRAEVVFPRVQGRLLRLLGANPGFFLRVIPRVERGARQKLQRQDSKPAGHR